MPDAERSAPRLMDGLRKRVPEWAIWTALGATLAGIVTQRMWTAVAWPRVGDLLFLALAALLAGALIARLARIRLPTALLLAWLAALTWFVGPPAVAATALLAAAAFNIGCWLVPEMPFRPPVAMAVGLLVIAGIGGWLLPLPIHYPVVWIVVLLAPVLLRIANDFPEHVAGAGELRPRVGRDRRAAVGQGERVALRPEAHRAGLDHLSRVGLGTAGPPKKRS